jgi:Flp pilus assembly protein TadB
MSIESAFKIGLGVIGLGIAAVGCYKSYQSYQEQKDKTDRSIRESEEKIKAAQAKTERARKDAQESMRKTDAWRKADQARHEEVMAGYRKDQEELDRYNAYYSELLADLEAGRITPDELVKKIKAYK